MYSEKVIRVLDKQTFAEGYLISFRSVDVTHRANRLSVDKGPIVSGIISSTQEDKINILVESGKTSRIFADMIYDEQSKKGGTYREILAVRENALPDSYVSYSWENKKNALSSM